MNGELRVAVTVARAVVAINGGSVNGILKQDPSLLGERADLLERVRDVRLKPEPVADLGETVT